MIIIPRQRTFSLLGDSYRFATGLAKTAFNGVQQSDGTRIKGQQAALDKANDLTNQALDHVGVAKRFRNEGRKFRFPTEANLAALSIIGRETSGKVKEFMDQAKETRAQANNMRNNSKNYGFFNRTGNAVKQTWNSGTAGKVAVGGTAALALGTTAAAAALLNRRKKKKREAAQQNANNNNNNNNNRGGQRY